MEQSSTLDWEKLFNPILQERTENYLFKNFVSFGLK